MKQLIHNYNDWMCFSINHLNIAFFFGWFLFLKALKGFIRRISKGCIQSASSRNSKCSSVPQTCLLVFLKFCWGTTQFWTVNVRICIWPWDPSFKSASNHDLSFFWRLQLESPRGVCAARCGLGLLAQPCTQLRFILFTPGIVWSTFQTVAASVTDPSCNCIKGISLLRKHHSWISPNVNWDSSMSLINDGTFKLYLLCSKKK